MLQEKTDFTATIPDEILCTVFVFLQSIDPIRFKKARSYRSREGKDTAPPSQSGWINVTYVNSRWRSVALQHAVLWARLTGNLGTLWLDEFIRRSRSAPLSVEDYVGRSPDVQDPMGEVLFTHRTRIFFLSLHSISHFISLFKDPSACNFERLDEIHIEERHDTDTCFPLHLLLDRAPFLRRLRLELEIYEPLAFDSWTHTTLSNVTSLTITTMGSLPISDSLDVFRRMEKIEELSLSEQVDEKPHVSCDRCRQTATEYLINLCSLKSMILDTSTETLAHVLRHVIPSPDARLMLYSSKMSAQEHVHDVLSQGLESLSRSRQGEPAFQSADMTYRDHTGQDDKTYGGTGPIGVTIGLAHSPRLIRLLIRPNHQRELQTTDFTLEYAPIMRLAVLPHLRLDSVHTLCLSDVGIAHRHAADQLAFFTNVERLRLSITTPKHALYHGVRFLNNTQLLPRLRVLDMDRAAFDLLAVLKGLGYYSLDTDPPLESLLQTRKQAGRPLQAVYLHIEEEIAAVKQRHIHETSCKGLKRQKIMDAIKRLETVEGLHIVSKDYDPFAAWPSV